LNSVIVNVSRIVGPALAGILIATVGLSWRSSPTPSPSWP